MSTNHVYRRQPHSALRKKRMHPAKMPKLDLDNGSSSSGNARRQPAVALDRRQSQIIGLGTDVPIIPPATDILPPVITNGPVPPPSPTSESSTTTPPPSPPTTTSSTPSTTSTTPTTTSAANTTTTQTQAAPATTSAPTTSRQTVTQTRTDDATVVITNSITRSTGTAKPTNTLGSSEGDTDSSSTTGPLIGGIVAGVIAIAVLAIAIVWFVRRRKRNDDDVPVFDPNDFRRSAVLLDDAPSGNSAGLTRGPSSAGGDHAYGRSGNPRPPTMIERKLAHTPAPLGGYPGEYGYDNASYYGGEGYGAPSAYGNPSPYGYPQPQQVYTPGQYVESPHSNPFASPPTSAYHQSPFSPPTSADPSRATSPDEAAVLAQVGGAPVLTRSKSMRSMASGKSGKLSISIPKTPPVNAVVVGGSASSIEKVAEYPVLKRSASSSSSGSGPRRNNSVKAVPPLPSKSVRESLSESDYVDLSRSSVSPYQAAQYAEISKRLNADVPQGLPSSVVEELVKDRDLPPIPPPSPNAQASASPFADADLPILPPAMHTADNSLPGSPLSIIFQKSSRIDSTPPCLPEINIESTGPTDLSPHSAIRHESYLPPPGLLGLNSAKDSPVYPSPVTAGGSPLVGNRFPVTPSPLGASFVIETPRPVYKKEGKDGRLFAMQQEQARIREEREKEKEKEKKRPDTVYDLEDAYGGF